MNSRMIDRYIRDHQLDNYKPKYRYYSYDQIGEHKYKFHYYNRDNQLLQINVFLEIEITDDVYVAVCEDIYDQERNALTCDALKRIRKHEYNRKSLYYTKIPSFIKNPIITTDLTPQDMMNVYNYIKYHNHINENSIYEFYKIFIEYFKILLENGLYNRATLSFKCLLDEIIYEHVWIGMNIKYLDQEYLMHQAYIRALLSETSGYLEEFYQETPERVVHGFMVLFKCWRLAFSIYSSIEEMTKLHGTTLFNIILDLKEVATKPENREMRLVMDMIWAKMNEDIPGYRHSVKTVLKYLMGDILSYTNPQEQHDIGMMFLKREGFDLLLEIFDETKDPYVYTCFKIKEIPEELHGRIKKQLVDAATYYSHLTTDDRYRLEAIAQLAQINTLMIEHFN